jgi:hypothetical protein
MHRVHPWDSFHSQIPGIAWTMMMRTAASKQLDHNNNNKNLLYSHHRLSVNSWCYSLLWFSWMWHRISWRSVELTARWTTSNYSLHAPGGIDFCFPEGDIHIINTAWCCFSFHWNHCTGEVFFATFMVLIVYMFWRMQIWRCCHRLS